MRYLRPTRPSIVGCTLLLAFLVGGCGYSLVGRGRSTLPRHIVSVAVPLFSNNTLEPELEKEITTAIRQAFIRDGRLKVVDMGTASAILEGSLENYTLDPVAFDVADRVTQYRVVITVHITFKDMIKDEILLNQRFSAREEFEVTSALASREAAKVASRKDAADELAGQLLNLVLEGF